MANVRWTFALIGMVGPTVFSVAPCVAADAQSGFVAAAEPAASLADVPTAPSGYFASSSASSDEAGAKAPCDSRGSGCGDACCPCDGESCCGCGLCGLIAPSDRCFNRFISPQTNPLFFEDPRTLTELRFHFAHHNVPDDQPVLQGGEARFYAMQARVALSERLSLIAAKDGYIDLWAGNPAIGHTQGWADVAAGLKYNVIRDPAAQRVTSVGFTFEADAGSHQVFQGRGDGEFHFFLTGGRQIGDWSHWLSATGFRIPTDGSDRSQMWYWSNHVDYEWADAWYAVLEINWFHWLSSGAGDLGTNGFEGGDLFNLGSTGVSGNDIVTMGVGVRCKPRENTELGVAYEFPLTERRDLLENRIYVDWIVRY